MVYIGEIVNTHGIKGELRIISDFKYKDAVFFKGQKFYVGKRKQEVIINTYRRHKNYDMVTFEGINDINEAIIFKNDDVYIKREDLDIDGYVDEDLIGLDVYGNDQFLGKVSGIVKNKQDLLVVEKNKKNYFIPFVDEFIEGIDLNKKIINVKVIKGLIDEN